MRALQVCGAIFRMDSNANGPGVRYVWEHPEILDLLFHGCEPLLVLPSSTLLPYIACTHCVKLGVASHW